MSESVQHDEQFSSLHAEGLMCTQNRTEQNRIQEERVQQLLMHFDSIQLRFAALFFMQLAASNSYKVQCPAKRLQLSDVVS